MFADVISAKARMRAAHVKAAVAVDCNQNRIREAISIATLGGGEAED